MKTAVVRQPVIQAAQTKCGVRSLEIFYDPFQTTHLQNQDYELWLKFKSINIFFIFLPNMLYLIGLGLADETDITVRGLDIVRKAERVYLEAYTSILLVDKEKLVC